MDKNKSWVSVFILSTTVVCFQIEMRRESMEIAVPTAADLGKLQTIKCSMCSPFHPVSLIGRKG